MRRPVVVPPLMSPITNHGVHEMADVNKAQKRQSGHNKNKYAAQYGITYNNKRRAIERHIRDLEAVQTDNPTRQANIKAAIAAAKTALASLKLKA